MRAVTAVGAACLWLLASRSLAANVVFILTDDQDEILGSLSVMPNLMNLIASKGARFTNAFVNTPICCPSRATYTTGRYMHNTKVTDNSCGGQAFHDGPEKRNLAAIAQEAEPRLHTYFNGKYLNNFPSNAGRPGGACYSPPGWDKFWGLVGNSKYYDYDVCLCEAAHGQGGNSSACNRVHHGSDYAEDYYTDLLANDTLQWIRNVSSTSPSDPFLAVIHTPAPHVPNVCAPQYCGLFNDTTSPRVPSWNKAPQMDKHWLMRQIEPMNKYTQSYVSDGTFVDRWRALQSVDELVVRLMAELESLGRLDDTYVVYSSDHGQHLGEFGEAFDKRQPYETDIRVPLLVRGPGIAEGQLIPGMVGAIDIVPTLVSMIAPTFPKPEPVDGDTWLPLVNGSAEQWVSRQDILVEYNGPTIVPPLGAITSDPQAPLPEAMRRQRRAAREARQVRLAGKESLHSLRWDAEGEFTEGDTDDANPMPAPPGVIMCGGERGSTPCDAVNNTYACIRTINITTSGLSPHSLYCQFNDDEDYVEFYTNVNTDPWETTNVVNTSDPATVKAMANRLRNYQVCSGNNCRNPTGLYPPPAPAGSVQLHNNQGGCLAATGAGQLGVTYSSCVEPNVGWFLSNDSLGHPQIKSASDSTCVNLDNDVCAAGTYVHLYDCQGNDSRVHTADHWRFDAQTGTLQPVSCPGMCLVAESQGETEAAGSDWAAVTIAACGTAGTSGWTSH